MLKTISAIALGLLLSFSASAADPYWLKITTGTGGQVGYVDIYSVKGEGNAIKAWVKYTDSYKTVKQLTFFLCGTKETYTVYEIMYYKDDVVSSGKPRTVTEPVVPGSMDQKMFDSICITK